MSLMLDAVALVALAVIAGRYRLMIPAPNVTVDWTNFLRSANDWAGGRLASVQLAELYTSVPSLLFAPLVHLFPDLGDLFTAWRLLGVLAALMIYVVVRLLAGPLAGFAAGLVPALGPWAALVSIGLKSPYHVAFFTGGMVLGLIGATRRAPWGVPVLIGCTALAVAFHLGLWPMAPVACVLALVHLWRLPLRARVWAAVGAFVAGGLVLVVVLGVDLRWLRIGLEGYARHFRPENSTLGLVAPGEADYVMAVLAALWRPALYPRNDLLAGLDFTEESYRAVRAALGLGLAAALVHALLWVRARRRGVAPSKAWRAQGHDLAVGVQALLLLVAGSYGILRLGVGWGYLQCHHLVPFPPLILGAVAGLLRGVGPPRPAIATRLLPLLPLAFWAWEVDKSLASLGLIKAPEMGALATLPVQLAAQDIIRADAESREARPVVYVIAPQDLRADAAGAVLNELVLLGDDPAREPLRCYLLASPAQLALFSLGTIAVPGEARLSVASLACEELAAMSDDVCDRLSKRILFSVNDEQARTHQPCVR